MWHVLFKNVNYLNTVSENDQIDHNLTKNENLIEYKTKIGTKLNKINKNKPTQFCFETTIQHLFQI